MTKLDYARFLCAALSFLSGRQRDRIGLVTFDAERREIIPPSVRHVNRVLLTLNRTEPGGEGDLTRALVRVGEGLGRRGILVIISDFYADAKRLADVILPLRFRGQDVIIFHVLDHAELEFSFEESAMFRDVETGDSLSVVPSRAREEYRKRIRAHLEELERRLTGGQVDYTVLDTSLPLDHALFRYLSVREALKR